MGIMTQAILNPDGEDRSVGRQDVMDMGAVAVKKWEKKYAEVLSMFRTTGEDGLIATMANYQSLDHKSECLNPMLETPQFQQASQRQKFAWLLTAISVEFCRMFLALWERGALNRLLVVDVEEDFTPEAREQLKAMRVEADSVERPARAEGSVAAAPAQAAPAAPKLTPLAQCLLDYRGDKTKGIAPMKSDEFRKRYVSGPGRTIWDQAVAANLV
jgi:hypothetical protein